MAEVITAVGAGGKTTCLTERGRAALRMGKSVCFTTSTKIWAPGGWEKQEALPGGIRRIAVEFPEGTIDYMGRISPEGKLLAPPMELLSELRSRYALLLIEADGSRSMPMKIPSESEPVLPDFTSEIDVLMGLQAVGRKIGVVCHRFWEADPELVSAISGKPGREGNLPVTEEMLRKAAEICYLKPLRQRFPEAKIQLILNDPLRRWHLQGGQRVTMVLLASGFSRRYGSNKLLSLYKGKALYLHALESLLLARDSLAGPRGERSLGSETSGIRTDILVVTQYPEILEEIKRRRGEGLLAVPNAEAMEGISASIRIGTNWAMAKGADAVLFFAADMPDLPGQEICRYLRLFLSSGKTCGCMETVPGGIFTNPGVFRLKEEIPGELLSLSGDQGAMGIIRRRLWDTYRYQISQEEVRDIDRAPGKADLHPT